VNTTTATNTAFLVTASFSEGPGFVMFYKLATGKGWIPSQDSKTGAPLVQKI
jgi:hypothetical protein